MTGGDSFQDMAISLVRRAILAPSSHNTQPWRFRISDLAIDVLADRTRALPVNDPVDRELTISCGCALLNLRVAAAKKGLGVGVTLLPDATETDWLARLEPDSWLGSHPADGHQAEAIGKRHTYRKQFAATGISADVVAALIDAAGSEGAWVRSIQGAPERRAIAALIAEGDAAQWSDRAWRRELAAWMHPRADGDGLTVPLLAAPVTRLVVRTFNMGRSVGAKDARLAESAPLLLIIGTGRDDARDWLLAGQALQRVLLTARTLGMQASFFNQPVQVASLRPQLVKLTGGGFPQIVLRVGYPSAVTAATPRRPLEHVLVRSTRGVVTMV